MRTLIVTENVTLDGVMSDPDLSYQSDDLIATNKANMAAADALLLGRKTYQEFAGFWPYQTDDPTGVAEYINQVAKYVVSSTLDKADWVCLCLLVTHETCVRAMKPCEGQRCKAE